MSELIRYNYRYFTGGFANAIHVINNDPDLDEWELIAIQEKGDKYTHECEAVFKRRHLV